MPPGTAAPRSGCPGAAKGAWVRRSSPVEMGLMRIEAQPKRWLNRLYITDNNHYNLLSDRKKLFPCAQKLLRPLPLITQLGIKLIQVESPKHTLFGLLPSGDSIELVPQPNLKPGKPLDLRTSWVHGPFEGEDGHTEIFRPKPLPPEVGRTPRVSFFQRSGTHIPR